MMMFSRHALATFVFVAFGWVALATGQAAFGSAQTVQPISDTKSMSEGDTGSAPPANDASPDNRQPASINGTIVDESGAVVAGAEITFRGGDAGNHSGEQEVRSGTDGQFFLPKVAPGAFTLTITAAGFAGQTFSGTVHSGEVETIPAIALAVAEKRTEVEVSLSQVEVAEEQMKIEEKQRVLGVVPNFYVTYIADAAPMTAKQKFRLAVRTTIDPFTIFIAGAVAGIEQGQNHFAGYGQGADGYGKRFGASYADATTGTMLGGAVFPALLKQDPRYFYKGTGSTTSRALYAIANAFICKGDNKRWQPNYSNVLGSLASGGISNLYYPAQDRNGFGLTFANAAIGVGSTAIQNLLQEFIVRKLTPKTPKE